LNYSLTCGNHDDEGTLGIAAAYSCGSSESFRSSFEMSGGIQSTPQKATLLEFLRTQTFTVFDNEITLMIVEFLSQITWI
jgi:hypothetical protein